MTMISTLRTLFIKCPPRAYKYTSAKFKMFTFSILSNIHGTYVYKVVKIYYTSKIEY
jgi:hypothetical protein